MLPAVAAGGVVAAASGIVTVSSFSAGAVYTVALVVAVLVGSALPWFALGTTSTRVDQAHSDADITAEPRAVHPEVVRKDARLGHEILLAVTATVGLLVVLVGPLAVGLGVTGALVVVCACAVLMLRTRQYRVGSEVATGLVCGVAGLVAVAVSIIVEQPTWHVTLALRARRHGRGPARLHPRAHGSVGTTRVGWGTSASSWRSSPCCRCSVFAIGLVGAVGS